MTAPTPMPMPMPLPPVTALRAHLMRELLLDPQGRPMSENGPSDDPEAIAAHWALCDSLEPTLTAICEGELVFTAADDGELLRQHVATELADSQNAVRAVFRPFADVPEGCGPRMGDLIVAAVASDAALSWDVALAHDDMPEVLTTPGELCLVLRDDLGLIQFPAEFSSSNERSIP